MARRKGNGPTPKQVEIEDRRLKVATLSLSGRHQKEIAKTLGISLGTVNADLKHMLVDWQNSQLFAIDNAKMIDLHRIEIAIKSIWMRVTEGNLLAIDRFERLTRLRAEILGYKNITEAVDANWQPITVIEVIKDYGPPAIEGESRLLEMDPDE